MLRAAIDHGATDLLVLGDSQVVIDDVKALLEPRAKKLAGAIVGRALYDGRLDPAAALQLIRSAV